MFFAHSTSWVNYTALEVFLLCGAWPSNPLRMFRLLRNSFGTCGKGNPMATKVAIVMVWGEKGRLSFLNLGISQWWNMRFTSRFHTPKQ